MFLVAGCASRPIPPPARLPGLAEVLARIRDRRSLSSFRSVVVMEVHVSSEGEPPSPFLDFSRDENQTFSGKAVLLWKAPDALRLEVLSPFGSPIFVAVAKGNNLRALSVARGLYYAGRTDRDSMARWLGLSVSSTLMLRVLQGGMPLLRGAGADGMRLGWSGEIGALRLEIPPEAGGGRRQVAFLDLNRFEPREVRIGEKGSGIEVRYGPFGWWGEARVPAWVEIEDTKRGHRVRFQLMEDGERPRKGETPPIGALADDLFDLFIPPGAAVIPLEGRRVR